MSEEKYQLTVSRFRDIEGSPTCAIDFTTGKVCPFYATQKFGLHETCWFASKQEMTSGKWMLLHRRMGSTTSLIPGEFCPIWTT